MKNILLTIIASLIFGNFSFGQYIEMAPLGAPSGSQISHFTVNEAGTILAVQNTGQFFRSTDNGSHWTEIKMPSTGLPTTPICHPDGSFFYLGAGGINAFQIQNDKDTVNKIQIFPGLDATINSITVAETGEMYALFYSEIYKSIDAGKTWKFILSLVPQPGTIPFEGDKLMTFKDSDFIYLNRYRTEPNQSTKHFVFRFKKDGSDFEQVFESPRLISEIVRQKDETLVIATHSGAFAGNETDLDFQLISDPQMQFFNLSLSETEELIFVEKNGFFRKESINGPMFPMDLGNNPGRKFLGNKLLWNKAAGHYFLIQKNTSPTNFFRIGRDFGNWHPLTPKKITLPTDQVAFKSAKNSLFIKPKTGTEGYYVSKNDGKTFHSFLVNTELTIEQLAKGKDTLLFAIAEDKVVYSTSNEGKNWKKVNKPSEIVGSGAIPTTLRTGPFGEVLIEYFNSGKKKFFYSKDNGDSWRKISEGTVGTKHFAFHPSGDIFGVFYPTDYVRDTDTADLRKFTPLRSEWENIREIHGETSEFSISERGLIRLKSSIAGVGEKTYISDDLGETMTETDLPEFYTAPNGLLFAINQDEIILSKNRGEDWEQIYQHGSNNQYRNLYLDFENYLYAVFENGPIYRSEEPIIENNFITGNIFIDENKNCAFDSREITFPGVIIRAAGATDFYAMSDENGQFVLPVLSDDYEVSVQVNDGFWMPCTPSVNVSLSGVNNLFELNIPLQPAVECPGMEVNLVVPEIQQCEESIFRVKYCNKGTKKAMTASVELELDPRFSIIESEAPIAGRVGNVVSFYLGDVELFECGEFSFTTAPVCDFDIGEKICSEARIFPNDLCIQESANWSGASLRVTGKCVGDDVEITVDNVGQGDMLIGRPLVIIEDLLLMRDPELVAISAGESIEYVVTPNGQTIRVVLEQVEGHPGFSNPSITLENCELEGTNPAPGGDNYGINPFVETACSQVTNRKGLFLPNFGELTEQSQNLIGDLEVKISPNPVSETAIIQVLSNENEGEFTCELIDANGKVIRLQTTDSQQVMFSREGLVSGIYFYKIYNKTGQVASGKIIVK